MRAERRARKACAISNTLRPIFSTCRRSDAPSIASKPSACCIISPTRRRGGGCLISSAGAERHHARRALQRDSRDARSSKRAPSWPSAVTSRPPKAFAPCGRPSSARRTSRVGQSLVQTVDFYSTSGCRDMFFNVMEHRLTIADIKSFLDEHGFAFLGFELDPKIVEQFRQRNPARGCAHRSRRVGRHSRRTTRRPS